MTTFPILRASAQKLGIALTEAQLGQFHRYCVELLTWNQRVNLTAITSPTDVEILHFLDSLSMSLGMLKPSSSGYRVCDVGSGAGFPGLPLKIAFPQLDVTLIEATSKKTAFLAHLVSMLALENVEVQTGRAEDLAHQAHLREAFDLVTARAVAELRVLLEMTLPFCRVGGCTILQKKGDVAEEVGAASRALQELGGKLRDVVAVPEEVLPGQRMLIVVDKVQATPAHYPRRPGMPAKHPL